MSDNIKGIISSSITIEGDLQAPEWLKGERGEKGWGLSGAELDEDGALVLTIRNPADGSTQTLPPVPIDNSAALQAVVEAITDQGTTQVQRVETAGSTAVGEVSTAKDAALQAVGQAQTTATGAVSSAQTTAVRAVQDAKGTATTAISKAQADAVGAVDAAKTDALESISDKSEEEQAKLNAIVPPPTPEDAGKALVVNEDGTGLKYGGLPGGAGIDDDVIAKDSTWSSRMIVDSLAPEFSETGAVVTCNPVAGYPLSIQAQIVPLQEGSGDPSPDNVKPISGWDSATLTHNDTTITIQFGQTVYGGTLDWTTGVLTIDKIVVLANSEILIGCYGVGSYNENLTNFYIELRKVLEDPTSVLGENAVSNQLKLRTNEPQYIIANIFYFGAIGTINAYIGFNIENTLVGLDADDSNDVAVQKLKSYLNANPISFVVSINSPQIVQLTPQEILALSGVNTIHADTGDVTVSGRADPNSVIRKLASRIAALESAAVTNA